MAACSFLQRKAISTSIAVFAFGLGVAHAGQIVAGVTGLTSPVSTVDFSELSLAANTVLTTQYAGFGVSFSPNVYYDAETTFFPNEVSNFTDATEPGFINPVVISFTSPQTSAAFQIVADDTPYLFQAFSGGTGGTLVDSFTSTVAGDASLYYGFTNETFDTIEITQEGDGGGPYWDLSNIELSNAAISGVPEASSMLLVGPALAGLWIASRRRSARSRAN
jgi:hypothetical protein